MSHIKIQPAFYKEAAAIARVHVDTWRTAYSGIVPDDYLADLSYEKREKMWRDIISDNLPKEHTWVAKNAAQEIVGFVNGGKNRDGKYPYGGEIYALYLLKEYERQGVGRSLLLESLAQLYRHGFLSAMVWVLEENPTLEFYKKHGGEIVGEKWDEIGGKKLKEIALAWPDISKTLQTLDPSYRHPNITNYAAVSTDDHENYYPGSTERLSIGVPFARMLGLKRLGIHHELLPPGRRTSWPHAEEDEEEFIYVLEGTPQVWIDGNLHQLKPGDGVGFSCGTGMCHTFINNSDQNVRLLVVGEASKKASKIFYPLNPSRREQVGDAWWSDVPKRPMGEHDGKPTTPSPERK